MTQDDVTQIETLQRQLRETLARYGPGVIAMEGDNEAVEIVGNESGFLKLAIESLEAARGRGVGFEQELRFGDPAFHIVGMKFDPNPKLEEPIRSARSLVWLGFSIFVLLFVVFAVGLITTLNWLGHLFFH